MEKYLRVAELINKLRENKKVQKSVKINLRLKNKILQKFKTLLISLKEEETNILISVFLHKPTYAHELLFIRN